MAYNVIRSDDPQALEKLTEKLEKLTKYHETMKKMNVYYRKNNTVKGFEGLTDAAAQKIDEKIKNAYSWAQQPYPKYEMTNNNAEINRIKKRIEQLTQDKELGFEGWTFEGGEVVANDENCRLQIFFDERPSEEQRIALKQNGFKWAPSEGAWQRLLNASAIYAADRIDFIKPDSGQRPSQLQPKAPKKDAPEK